MCPEHLGKLNAVWKREVLLLAGQWYPWRDLCRQSGGMCGSCWGSSPVAPSSPSTALLFSLLYDHPPFSASSDRGQVSRIWQSPTVEMLCDLEGILGQLPYLQESWLSSSVKLLENTRRTPMSTLHLGQKHKCTHCIHLIGLILPNFEKL